MNDCLSSMIGVLPHPSYIRSEHESGSSGEMRQGKQLSKKLALIQQLRFELPPTFTRQYICDKLGGFISPKTLSNLDSRGEGPASRIALGRRISYERDDFLDWLENRLQNR